MSITSVRIPKAAQSMHEGTIAQWLVADLQTVEAGQPLYLLETDKVEMEIESPVSGRVCILAPAGTTHDVGVEIARIEPDVLP
jgi:pyruvate/2-oxoglutarate dehydrogenase complex dihydrolipoamide acyltransferase (E2) component